MRKDAAELTANLSTLLPAIWMAIVSVFPGFLVAILAPLLAGETLAESEEFAEGTALAVKTIPELAALDGNALIQGFLFHQFSLLILMVPVVGSMAIAAHAVIGEKLARTLEPLLATPISTAELLIAKAMTPLVFGVVLMWITLAAYIALIGVSAEPGVWQTMVGPRMLVLFFLVGPLDNSHGAHARRGHFVARQRSTFCPAAGCSGRHAGHGSVRRPTDRPIPRDLARHPAGRTRPGGHQSGPGNDWRAALRPGKDSDEVEISALTIGQSAQPTMNERSFIDGQRSCVGPPATEHCPLKTCPSPRPAAPPSFAPRPMG